MINVALIGYGYWGNNLARNISESDHMSLSYIVELNPDNAERARRRYPAARVTEVLWEALNDKNVDAVMIATPVHTHYEVTASALDAGKHVWLEKPMAETSEQARRLVETARRNGLTLFVDHTFLYTGAIRKMKEIVASGELGDVYYYDSTRINLGLFQRDVNVISDLAVHDFSILSYLLDEEPIAVSASGVTHFEHVPESLAYVTVFYGSGAIAHVNVSWMSPVKLRQILLGGSKKMILYDDMANSEKIKLFDSGVKLINEAEEIYKLRVGYRTGDMWAPKLETTEALRVAADHFVDCIKTGRNPISSGLLGANVVDVIEAATQSMLSRGKTVELERAFA